MLAPACRRSNDGRRPSRKRRNVIHDCRLTSPCSPSVSDASTYFHRSADPGGYLYVASCPYREPHCMILQKAPVDKVLIVDNDPDDRFFFAEALREAAPNVALLEASGLDEMRGLLCVHLPDLIFIDINMPGADGFECLAHVRRSELLRTIPVVMHSTAAQPTQIARAYSQGAHLYFRKPSHFAVYVMGIHKLLTLDWMHPERVQGAHRRGARMFDPVG
ncbi:MAG: response regulator [Chitinophagaceae bacterium]|nr:MAG: response regulator [Chitinophagaceae bacterium]